VISSVDVVLVIIFRFIIKLTVISALIIGSPAAPIAALHLHVTIAISHLSILGSKLSLIMLLMIFDKSHLILSFVGAVRVDLVRICRQPVQLVLVRVFLRPGICILELDHFIKDNFNLALANCVRLPIVKLKELTLLEFVVFHVNEPVFKLIGVSSEVIGKQHLQAIKTRLTNEPILEGLISKILRELLVLVGAALQESDGTSLICRELHLFIPLN